MTTKADKIWSAAISKAVHQYITEKTPDGVVRKTMKLNKLAETLVGMACKGDVQAIKEIGDRLDGRAKQQSEVEVTHIGVPSAETLTDEAWEREHGESRIH